MTAPVRIANSSGLYRDRLSAAREMVDGGPIDVLTGDGLILADPAGGDARTFLTRRSRSWVTAWTGA